jgi:hypothetical protein
MIINATIINGEGSASGYKKNWLGHGTIYHQINQIQKIDLSFSNQLRACKMGTINICTDNAISILRWERTFIKLAWLPNSPDWGETIYFSSVLIRLNNSTNDIRGWLYGAEKSPHNKNPHILEIVAPEIIGLKSGDNCQVQIDCSYIQKHSN